ncbi:hypothetical protein K457DRAFT_28303 [Linnemannia elongata AG-77]|uniref:IML1 N-terminal double psi beta-barrel domain-containing protein n=1 Tax=Linnemannia elongata AG-77 TaxID=1314771 RepID=A0A197KDA0_9FUNG|nr:hypothetical protein K457DRAFT_28303 [Linnemannia elongata AG-77]
MFASASNVGTGAPLGSGVSQDTSILQHTTSAGGTDTPSTGYNSPQSSSAATPPLGATKCLYIHSDHFSTRDFLINPAFFPNVQPNDLFEIYDPTLPEEAQNRLTIRWTGPDNNAQLRAPVQVSLTHSIAREFGLTPRLSVIVQRV